MAILEDPVKMRQDREGGRNDRLLLVLDDHREPLEVPDLMRDGVDAVVDRVEARNLEQSLNPIAAGAIAIEFATLGLKPKSDKSRPWELLANTLMRPLKL